MPARIPQSLALVVLGLAAASCDINLAPDPIAPTRVELTPDRVTLAVGDTTVIRSSVERADLGGRLDMSSLDPDIATVNQFGVVRGVSPGTTQVVGSWFGRYTAADTAQVVVVAR